MSGTCSTRSDVSNAHEVLVRKPRLKETIWRQHVDKILKCLTETLSEVVNRTAVEMSKPPAPELQQQVLHYMCSRRSGSASKRIYTDGFCVGKRSSEFAIGHSKITTISNYASLCFKKSPPPRLWNNANDLWVPASLSAHAVQMLQMQIKLLSL